MFLKLLLILASTTVHAETMCAGGKALVPVEMGVTLVVPRVPAGIPLKDAVRLRQRYIEHARRMVEEVFVTAARAEQVPILVMPYGPLSDSLKSELVVIKGAAYWTRPPIFLNYGGRLYLGSPKELLQVNVFEHPRETNYTFMDYRAYAAQMGMPARILKIEARTEIMGRKFWYVTSAADETLVQLRKGYDVPWGEYARAHTIVTQGQGLDPNVVEFKAVVQMDEWCTRARRLSDTLSK
jgi:hypothetical protein